MALKVTSSERLVCERTASWGIASQIKFLRSSVEEDYYSKISEYLRDEVLLIARDHSSEALILARLRRV
jgi:hypothetical protein